MILCASHSPHSPHSEHPGGKKVLTRVAGKDASDQFNQLHKASVLDKVAKPFEVGILKK